jgi:hypothetical protein
MTSSSGFGILALGLMLTAMTFALTSESALVILMSAAVVLCTLAVGVSVLESRSRARAHRFSRPRRG